MVVTNKKNTAPSFDEFCHAVAQRLKIDKDKLCPEFNWVDDVGISSIDIVKIVMLIRQKFGIKISTTQAGRVKTVYDTYQILLSEVK